MHQKKKMYFCAFITIIPLCYIVLPEITMICPPMLDSSMNSFAIAAAMVSNPHSSPRPPILPKNAPKGWEGALVFSATCLAEELAASVVLSSRVRMYFKTSWATRVLNGEKSRSSRLTRRRRRSGRISSNVLLATNGSAPTVGTRTRDCVSTAHPARAHT